MIGEGIWPNKDEVLEVSFYTGDLTNEEFRLFNDNLIERYGVGVHDGADHWISAGYHTTHPYCAISSGNYYFVGWGEPRGIVTLNARLLLNPIWCKEE